MAENTKIQWAHHTFNPWRGCTKVSDGCKNCYAAVSMSVKMHGIKWGPQGERRVASDAMWKEPLKWNRKAEAAGERHRVFCASLADVFEGRATMPESAWGPIAQARLRLFELIDKTPNLDWLLLTKRPENIHHILSEEISLGTYPESWNLRDHLPNVWLGTTVENQAEADKRIPELLKVPAKVRFLSCEPLLGPVDLSKYLVTVTPHAEDGDEYEPSRVKSIDWVIVGGESGPRSRAFDIDWAWQIIGQCATARVPVFIKQLGANAYAEGVMNWPCATHRPATISDFNKNRTFAQFADKKGGTIEEWPGHLRVREVPNA